jgi:DNA-binding beta-propeller fold protein YncE
MKSPAVSSTTRRRFLASTAAALTAPQIMTAQKSGNTLPITGKGEHRYEMIHDWAQLPDRFKWQTTQDVAVSREGLVFIIHDGSAKREALETIFVFDQKGKFVRSFGKEFDGGGHGIDIRLEGNQEYVYICDRKHLDIVVKTTLAGEEVWRMGRPEHCPFYEEKSPFKPTNVAFAPDGGFYVADGYGSFYVHQYDLEANWVRSWGGKGNGPGQMHTPHGLWMDTRSKDDSQLIVADRANHRLQFFDGNGVYKKEITDSLSLPANIDIYGDTLLVPDLNGRVVLFGKNNQCLTVLGDNQAEILADSRKRLRTDSSKWQPGKFYHPHDACFDHEGNILVCEWVTTGRVTKLRHLS